MLICFFFFQAEDGIRHLTVTGVQTCALPITATKHEVANRAKDTGFVAGPQTRERALVGGIREADRILKVRTDRKSVVEGKSVDLGGRRINKKKKKKK